MNYVNITNIINYVNYIIKYDYILITSLQEVSEQIYLKTEKSWGGRSSAGRILCLYLYLIFFFCVCVCVRASFGPIGWVHSFPN